MLVLSSQSIVQQYKKDFIDFVLKVGALKFGDFQLKSGRISPYFFNIGSFYTAEHLTKLSEFYAITINHHVNNLDILFGPAYKGIPLVSSVAMTLYRKFGINIKYSFNRKESKDHGEGGIIVGAKLIGNTVIIDDVITAGTAINEVMQIIKRYDAKVVAIIVAFDRQETGSNNISAIKEIEYKFGLKVFSIIDIDDIISYIKQQHNNVLANKIRKYRDRYGV